MISSFVRVRVRVRAGLDFHFAVWVSAVQRTLMQLLPACGDRELGLGLSLQCDFGALRWDSCGDRARSGKAAVSGSGSGL